MAALDVGTVPSLLGDPTATSEMAGSQDVPPSASPAADDGAYVTSLDCSVHILLRIVPLEEIYEEIPF